MNYYSAPSSRNDDSEEPIPIRIRAKIFIGFLASALIFVGMILSCVRSFNEVIFSKNPELIRSGYVLVGIAIAACIALLLGIFTYRIYRFGCFWSFLLLMILGTSSVAFQYFRYGQSHFLMWLILLAVIIGFFGSLEKMMYKNRMVKK